MNKQKIAKATKKIARDMVKVAAKVKKTDHVMIVYDADGWELAREIAKLSSKIGARVWYRVRDMDLDAVLVANMSNKNVARYYSFLNNEIMQADVVFMIRAVRDPQVMKDVPLDKMKIFNDAVEPIYMDYRVNHTNWQLIYWPVQSEADIEHMPFDEYMEMFINACNQPWKKISKAQEKLIKILNKGKRLELIANPKDPNPKKRTHISMSIDGMQFVNSTIDRNYPGAEVFSSPIKESVNGQLFAAGELMLAHEGKIVSDVHLEIKKGRVVKFSAGKRIKDLKEVLNRDEGARYFGEVALGTNPGLRRRVFNGLLNEKVGGSFHMALGRAYEDWSEGGKNARIDNGNRSQIHWDITVPMLPEYGGGEVKVDGKTIQKDGKFTLPGLGVLNEGL